MTTTTAVLPTGETMNPQRPEADTYFNVDQTAYVLFKLNEERTRPTRVVTSYGRMDWAIGSVVELAHDQTRTWLGAYRVTGIRDFATGQTWGIVPDMRIKHCVVK